MLGTVSASTLVTLRCTLVSYRHEPRRSEGDLRRFEKPLILLLSLKRPIVILQNAAKWLLEG